MSQGSSEKVRVVASEKYVQPAVRAGKTHFSIAVKDLMKDLVSEGFPPGNTPQVCTALRKKDFLREHGIEIEGVDGPPSKMSTTVVFRYRVRPAEAQMQDERSQKVRPHTETKEETPEQWAHRVTGKLAGLLKDELAEYGGGEAFIRWVRGYDEED
jgi:hypothetical protein